MSTLFRITALALLLCASPAFAWVALDSNPPTWCHDCADGATVAIPASNHPMPMESSPTNGDVSFAYWQNVEEEDKQRPTVATFKDSTGQWLFESGMFSMPERTPGVWTYVAADIDIAYGNGRLYLAFSYIYAGEGTTPWYRLFSVMSRPENGGSWTTEFSWSYLLPGPFLGGMGVEVEYEPVLGEPVLLVIFMAEYENHWHALTTFHGKSFRSGRVIHDMVKQGEDWTLNNPSSISPLNQTMQLDTASFWGMTKGLDGRVRVAWKKMTDYTDYPQRHVIEYLAWNNTLGIPEYTGTPATTWANGGDFAFEVEPGTNTEYVLFKRSSDNYLRLAKRSGGGWTISTVTNTWGTNGQNMRPYDMGWKNGKVEFMVNVLEGSAYRLALLRNTGTTWAAEQLMTNYSSPMPCQVTIDMWALSAGRTGTPSSASVPERFVRYDENY